MVIAEERTDLDCPWAEKEEAKALGARWDAKKQKWYVEAGADLDNFQCWMPGSRRYLRSHFAEKDEVKALGARFDAKERKWYITQRMDSAPFAKWLPAKQPDPADAPATPTRAPATPAEAHSPATVESRKRGREEGVESKRFCPVHRVACKGPLTVKRGQPHNIGREFYICPHKDDTSADGGACVSPPPPPHQLAPPPPSRFGLFTKF